MLVCPFDNKTAPWAWPVHGYWVLNKFTISFITINICSRSYSPSTLTVNKAIWKYEKQTHRGTDLIIYWISSRSQHTTLPVKSGWGRLLSQHYHPSGNVVHAFMNVPDVEPPKFTNGCPSTQRQFSGPLGAAVILTWKDPTTSDNSRGDVTMTSDPVSGSPFSPGHHVVRITATDPEGNAASCVFHIFIQSRYTYYASVVLPFSRYHVCVHPPRIESCLTILTFSDF